MDALSSALFFLKDIISQPAIIVGIFSMAGLLALRRSATQVMTGTLKPIIGFIMLSAGAGFLIQNLDPLGGMIEHGFGIKGVVPNNEAIAAIAQDVLGVQTMSIFVLSLLVNILVARFTRFKYIFLSGHAVFYMAAMISAVFSIIGLSDISSAFCGGIILGVWNSVSPALLQKYALKVTDGDEIAMGHTGNVGYFIAAWIGEKVGNPDHSTENMQIPEKYSFLRDSTVSTALTMLIFYLVAAIAAGPDYVSTLSNGQNYLIFAFMSALGFAVGVAIIYAGVRMILADMIPAFEGISRKLIPDAIPAVDCPVFFTYAPTAVVLGFIFSFAGGLLSMWVVGAATGLFIIPGLVPHFFCGASAGVFANATGGKRGAMIGAFIHGILITIAPAFLYGVMSGLGFENTTFGDTDYAVLGALVTGFSRFMGAGGIYLLAGLALALVVTSRVRTGRKVINHNIEAYE